jgi:hypothetical protein
MKEQVPEQSLKTPPCLASVTASIQEAIRAAALQDEVLMHVEPAITDALAAHRFVRLGLSRCALECVRQGCGAIAKLTTFPLYTVDVEPACACPPEANQAS